LTALQRLAALEPSPTRAEVREHLAHLAFGGRRPFGDAIRVLDPRTARTIDVDVAIVVGLEEQALGAAPARDPLVEAPEQSDVARHLAYLAATRPRQRLVLVRRVADDDGRPLAPTAIWEDLVVAAGDPAVTHRRRFSDTVYPLELAPTVRERARSIADLAAREPDEALRLAGAAGVTGAIRRALAARRRGTRMNDPRLLHELETRDPFGVTELDRFGRCSQVWFVERRLNPKRIDEPIDDRLRLGTIAHSVLNRFYREVPGLLNVVAIGPAEAARAVAEAERIVDEEMARVRPIVAGDRLRIDLMRWGLRRDIGRLVRRAARADAPLVPTEFEVSFGMRTAQAGRKDGVDVGPARLSGKIDRIDTDPRMTARAIVVDYKTSTIPTGPEIREKGELQVPLYLLALREVLGREPVGGLFVSIRKGETRGIVDAAEDDVLPPGLTRTDIVEHEEFEAALDAARADAGARILRMRAGDVRHDPADGEWCRKYCDYSGICRVRP
ncbi:MAG: PD-(D/E)XK nuclease family protein, partial [Gaiellales bacterium]